MATTNDVVNNALGAMIGIKTIETGFKLMDKTTKKTSKKRGRGFL